MTTAGQLNLIKLCVGAEGPDELAAWQRRRPAQGPDCLPRHVTRMWPKRADELLDGGSLFWVFKGVLQARQRILRLDEVDRGDGILRCGIVLDRDIVRTEARKKRPFQGWRYLPSADAPADLPKRQAARDLPPEIEAALAELGVRSSAA